MADGGDQTIARTISSISDVGADVWNRLANPSPENYNPFVSHEFLSALERSHSVSAETGWAPMHLLVEDAGVVTGAAPLFVKNHSQGEYVFDHHWADALHRAGGHYYPKLLCAAPFTPAPGPRLLTNDDRVKQVLGFALRQAALQTGASSAHVNFIETKDREALLRSEFLPRMGEQYHWFNRGYDSFDDFLSTLSSRKRKAIRRERREAAQGLTIQRLVGDNITENHWDAFWNFYQDTGARKWGQPYLTRTFFRLAAETMGDKILFIVAERDGVPVAGALNFIGGDALYGRYWGCSQDIPFLHFELCYHQAIDFAIERKLSRVEAGAQGTHKLARGYEPVSTWSAHWLANESFREAIARYLESERQHTALEIEALKDFTPFRKDA